MNSRIEKMKFKKIFIIYVVCLLLALIGFGVFFGIKYKDKFSFARNYHSVSEQFKDNSYNDKLANKLDNLSKNSKDIVDIFVLDKNNNVIYSSKKSELSNLETFNLERMDNKENIYFVNQNSQKIVFKLIRDKELMFSTIFSNLDLEIENKYEDDVFFETGYNEKDLYLLSYSANKETGEKIYFINQIHPISNAETYFKIAAATFVLFFMIYWVLVALVVYQNALKIKLNPYFWGIVTLITNLAGVVLYILYKQTGIICEKCNAFQDKHNVYCSKCGSKISEVCDECNHIIRKEDKYCSNCGRKL